MIKTGAKWFFALVGLVALISVGGLIIKLVMAPLNVAHTAANSASQIMQKTLDANNVIHNYEWFHDTNAAFVARANQLLAHRKFLGAEQDKSERNRLRMELAAQQQSCRELATRYNAQSEKINVGIFKGWSLPHELDINSCE